MKINNLILLAVALFSQNLFAQMLPVQGASDELIEKMAMHNKQVSRSKSALGPINFRSTTVLPFYEWDKTGYIVMSEDDFYGIAEEMKKVIAENIPANVTLIVYTQSSNKTYHKQIEDLYSKYIPKNQLKILQVPVSGSNDFWSRDNTPIPVWKDGKPALVDALYYYNFEPDKFMSKFFGVSMDSHNYFYEGGNFMANSKGDCLVVNRKKSYPGGVSDTAAIPDDIFKNLYGCKKLIRFKHLKGIGHADEVVKFVTDDIVLTDTKDYVDILKNAGFKVFLLPEPEYAYETYINSLIVNNVIFVPVFGENGDKAALDIYKNLNLGFKIIPINSRDLSTKGQGSIHCITQNYPPMPISDIVRNLNATLVK